jgi:alkylation response protein AidB-like acyl-CoA dehydrogenase
MNFGFTEEQDLLRREVRRFLDERCPLPEVRRIIETPSGYSEPLWKELGALGWLGLSVPEDLGGAGLSWLDLSVLLEETGRSLFPSPLIANTLAATALLELGSQEQKSRWLPGLCDGSRVGSPALIEESDIISVAGMQLRAEEDGDAWRLNGRKCQVLDPESANLFIVSFRTGAGPQDLALAVIEADEKGVSARSFPMIDASKRMGHLDLEDVRVDKSRILGDGGHAGPAIARLLDAGALAVTAEMAGAVDAALELSVAYAKERVQFEHPIGHFQGIKHPLAEIYVDAESFKSLLYYGAWCFDHRPEELPRYASLAKAYATEAFIRTGIDSIHIHGAMGFTTAHDIHLYFKRSKWARPIFGDAETHYERVLELRGL